MKIHRFYVGGLHDKRGQIQLRQHIWIHDQHLLNQWLKVLRLRVGDEIELFDDEKTTKLYKIDKIEDLSVGLTLVTEIEPTIPQKHVYLFWSLLKKDNNDFVLQKCTELGVKNFIPIISERTEKTGFDEERARRIVIEAAEQCGRSDIPQIREVISLVEAIGEYQGKVDLYICDQEGQDNLTNTAKPIGVIIGPEGGWSDAERQIFQQHDLAHLNLHDLTLRAETAAISAINKLVQ